MHSEVSKFFNKMAHEWDDKEVKDTKWLSKFIGDYVPIQPGMKVLDLGCGTGIISNIIFNKSKTKVVALDISKNMIDIAKQKHSQSDIEFYTEDFYVTNKSDFDMVLCFNAYPHFTDILRFKEKVIDILNENGYLVVLHSLSRKSLAECHKGLSKDLSRDLKPVDEEIKWYEDNFQVVNTIDNDDMFMMIFQKKCKEA